MPVARPAWSGDDAMTLHTMGGRRRGRARWVPLAAVSTAATIAVAAAVAGGGAAGAATAPNAQSAGNFLDATAGGAPIDDVVALAFARAENPGSVTDQNPLDVTVLGSLNLPLTGDLQFPQLLGITLGAANQVALARSTGASYGASGAVLNSGGVSVGGDNAAVPSNATIDLSASGVTGNSGVPVPGGGGSTADALGAVTASIGAVSSIARVPAFGPPLADSWQASCAADAATCYQIASLDLSLASPLVADTFGTISSQLSTALGDLADLAGTLTVDLPPECTFDAGLSSISLKGGAVVVDPSTGGLTIHLGALVQTLLGQDLNNLPANTDLIKVVTDYLADPDGLAAGLSDAISGLTTSLSAKFANCSTALAGAVPIGPLLTSLFGSLTSGETLVTDTIDGVVTALGAGTSPLAPLGDVLGTLLDLGANVQPGVATGDFTTALDALPKQGMSAPPVPYQYVVRALEVQIMGGNTATIALASSAAGPSEALRGSDSADDPTQPTQPTKPDKPNKPKQPAVVNSGLGAGDGRPPLAPVLLGLGVVLAGGLGLYRRVLAGTLRAPRS